MFFGREVMSVQDAFITFSKNDRIIPRDSCPCDRSLCQARDLCELHPPMQHAPRHPLDPKHKHTQDQQFPCRAQSTCSLESSCVHGEKHGKHERQLGWACVTHLRAIRRKSLLSTFVQRENFVLFLRREANTQKSVKTQDVEGCDARFGFFGMLHNQD